MKLSNDKIYPLPKKRDGAGEGWRAGLCREPGFWSQYPYSRSQQSISSGKYPYT